MPENDKLFNAIIELSQEIKGMRNDVNARFVELEEQNRIMNLHLAEHSRSIMALAEQQEVTNERLNSTNSEIVGLRSDLNKYTASNNAIIENHEKRIVRLEDATFSDDPAKLSLVKEPKATYKTKKEK